jgi:hypothetical protein
VSVALDLDPHTRAVLNKPYRVRVRVAQTVVVGVRLGAVSDEGPLALTGNVIGTFVAHCSDLRRGPVRGNAEAPEASDFAGTVVTVTLVESAHFGDMYIADHIERALASVGNRAAAVGAELAFQSVPLSYPGRTAGMKSLDTRFLNGATKRGLPAWIIMACAPERPESPEFVEYIVRVAAQRRGMSADALVKIAAAASEDALRSSKSSAPATETILFATVLGEAVREVACFYPYVTDMVDGNSGSVWSPSRVHPYEFFSSALRVAGGGDCEDKAREVCELYRGIMRMTFDPSQAVARAAWAVSRCYVPLMVLGEVESRAVTEYDRERTKQYLVAEDPTSTVRHNAHCYAVVLGTGAVAGIASRCPKAHSEKTVRLDMSIMLDPWETPLPPLLLDGTTGGVDVYPTRLNAHGQRDPEVVPYDALDGAWLTGRLDSKYYYTVRNCFVPYGLLQNTSQVYEIYWYSDTPEGTRHAAFIDAFYADPHARHPDCPGGIPNVRSERAWIAATVAPSPSQLKEMIPLISRLQPVPAYPDPPNGVHRSGQAAASRLRLVNSQHVSNAPSIPRSVAAVRADAASAVSVEGKVFFDIVEFVPSSPVLHLYVSRA